MMKNLDAYLVGYYGMRNSGDDALMQATMLGAKTFLGSASIAVNAPINNPIVRESGCIGQTDVVFRGHQRLKHYHRSLHSKAVIFGGGSVLHSCRDIAQKRHMIALAGAKNSMALGVGIEGFSDINAERQCKKFLNECGLVTVRDKQSYEIATLLAPHANIRHTFDLAPSLLHYFADRLNPVERQGIAFNFCPKVTTPFGDVNEQAEANRINKAAKLITATWEATREKIYLIELNDQPLISDRLVHDKIIAALPSWVEVQRISYVANPLATLKCISMFKALIGMRLHALVYAYMMQTPYLSLEYHNKCAQWCMQTATSTDNRFDANEFSVAEIHNRITHGLRYGFIQPKFPLHQAISLSISNWSESHEQNTILRHYSPIQ
ncbi:polysaccharide pyruvyl transferase family protein [Pseudoalteromonas sp. McH1-7]|uniref:polysaccharide pyruvyl transferase family protein n=1 Tax=Pseudoalteromonas TaxID=53246 RepID=UPI0015914BFC|nr:MULTISPECIES: polysaccharide pyruvyl transferase family protein [Pseudoalteromonas]MDW7549547.1 polysaccharide pyruvyl transferase family protein [Pseudoalteromonas peptidolytica]NUZ12494.1 polysaccharide pyruvyl transferase family protein [Pseudoalteromonas sp. McH1-7]USD29188.1 polysaccharide pyruvyl transferase family protein [Pseudoalteromonas sp. SCSIO 43201]